MGKHHTILYLAFISLFTTNIYAEDRKDNNNLIIGKDFKHDISLPLRDLKTKMDVLKKYYYNMPIAHSTLEKTPPLENTNHSSLLPVANFVGIGEGLSHYHVTQSEPDVNLAVGLSEYMQYGKPDIAIFDKSGRLLPNFPKSIASIWAGFGGICENFPNGRVSLKYDVIAKRWVVSQLASQDPIVGPFFDCTAVSVSDDVTGSYYRYAFQLNAKSTLISLAVWPDAYFLGLDMLGDISVGASMCALERDKMLLGDDAKIICKLIEQTRPLTPATLLDGTLLPPVGTPGYFFGLNPPDSITLYKFYADFENHPNIDIYTQQIPVKPYTPACQDTAGHLCVVQPLTSNRLDLINDRLLASVGYREFPGGYGSIVATHSVEGPQQPLQNPKRPQPKPAPALRWYEFRVNDSAQTRDPFLYQQSTLAPDTKHRFAGSISIDTDGNIALAYTVSSTRVHPSAEMAWHSVNDPLNKMTIQPLVTGTGSQIDNDSSWTEDTKLISDPFSPCTMFFTAEYLKTYGSFNWSTSVIKFKLPCLPSKSN